MQTKPQTKTKATNIALHFKYRDGNRKLQCERVNESFYGSEIEKVFTLLIHAISFPSDANNWIWYGGKSLIEIWVGKSFEFHLYEKDLLRIFKRKSCHAYSEPYYP